MTTQILILDYGMGNLHTIKRRIDEFNARSIVSTKLEDVKSSDKIILPRVGHFGKAVENLMKLNLVEELIEFALVRKKSIQSIDNYGVVKGCDNELIKRVSENVSLPVVALSGAGSIVHLENLNSYTVVNGFGCGSLFVYLGAHKGILINYIAPLQRNEIFRTNE
jgi:imidazole glycerol phosphate synthase subunit HisF